MGNLLKSKMNISTGDIWLCFEGTKHRPVLIISDQLIGIDVDVLVSRVTSQQIRNRFDIKINHWREAGLNKESVVRCSKITHVNYMNLIRKIGELHADDMILVRKALAELFMFKDL